jgi:NitT/TauT family transport system substrate-binding protein
MLRIVSVAFALCATLTALPAQAQTRMKIGLTKTVTIGGALYAAQKGWFKDAGLDVDVQFLDASASAMVLLATNELQFVEGGLSASFFNGLQQGLPVRIATDSVSSPTGHALVLRADLAATVKTLKDLKGRNIAVNAPSSISLYELAKILDSARMKLSDVETKIIAFNQMEAAFKSRAVDAAILVNPWVAEIPRLGLGVSFVDADTTVKPFPIVISATFFNSDWAAKNGKAMQDFYTQMLRGVRAYCDAYHGGATRAEVSKVLIENGLAPNQEFLDKLQWTSRSPDGDINEAFVLDVQRWYVEQGLLPNELPVSRLIDGQWAQAAVKALGPYQPDNKASTLKGCGRPS